MRSPATAIGWQFVRRHRWGFIAIGVYLLLLAAMKVLNISVSTDDGERFGFFVMAPMSATFIYFLSVFTFGLDGDLAAQQSIYPPRMFTLPVATDALVAWPMIFGGFAMALLWVATRFLAMWPARVAVPIAWPALLAASLLAWTQALTWMPYRFRGLRVVVTVAWLAMIDTIVFIALNLHAREAVMLAILAPHLPLAYLVGRYAVGRARRGDVPVSRSSAPSSRSIALDFPSASRAQEWFEWRLRGWTLPALVAMVLPFELAFFFMFHATPSLIFEALFCVLFTPVYMAIFVSATDSNGLTPFIAVRPASTSSLVAAKLKLTMRSTLAAWLLIGIALPVALSLSGAMPVVLEQAGRLAAVIGTARAVVVGLLIVAALIASTWKQLLQSLCIGMTGRTWVGRASIVAALAFVSAIGPVAEWIFGDRRLTAMFWNSIPWIAGALVCVKMVAGVWMIVRLNDAQLVSARSLIAAAACWSAAVFAVYGAAAVSLPGLLARHYLLALIAILAVPLVRLSALPVALAWNRHR